MAQAGPSQLAGTKRERPPLGDRDNPIPREDLVRLLPIMTPLKARSGERWRKVTPMLVLYPDAEERAPGAMRLEVPGSVRTLLRTRDGQPFEEALMQCHGKALLLDFCTPHLEAYPKDPDDCRKVYEADSSVVPERASVATVTEFLGDFVQQSAPLAPNLAIDVARVVAAMRHYKQALGRSGPWRVAFHRRSATLIAAKLSGRLLEAIVQKLCARAYHGERLFCEESFSPAREFGSGDWVCVDVDPATGGWRADQDGSPLVRTMSEAAFESSYNRTLTAPVGTRQNPIARKDFVRLVLPRLVALQAQLGERWRKMTPTLVLYPDAEERSPGTLRAEVPGSVRTLLRTRDGQPFEEALMQCHGKALLLDFCTPHPEVYPKDPDDCRRVYDMEAVDESTVPEDNTHLAASNFLATRVQQTLPMRQYTAIDVARVVAAMRHYKQALGRSGPWRIAFTTPSATVVAHKLTRADLGAMLTGLRRAAPWAGERLFCEEPSAPAREFGMGDWVCVDLDPETGSLRLGQDGSPLVRTVNEAAFESSYNSIF